jgi:hypothetical protein
MSAKALYSIEGGDFWIPVSELLANLPKGKKLAGELVWHAIVDYLPRDPPLDKDGKPRTPELRITDRMLQMSPWLEGFSLRFIQKGLQALSAPYEKRNKDGTFRTVNEDGVGLIYRERRRGLRTIFIIRKLKGGKKGADRPPRKQADPRTVPIQNDRKSPAASPAQIAAAARAVEQAKKGLEREPTPEEVKDHEEIMAAIRKKPRQDPLPPTSGP